MDADTGAFRCADESADGCADGRAEHRSPVAAENGHIGTNRYANCDTDREADDVANTATERGANRGADDDSQD
jgi:hypothetical protein